MEPTAEEIQTMRLAIEKNLVSAIETRGGECVAYDEKSGKEYGHKWRNGEARVFVEGEGEDNHFDVVFRVVVEIVRIDKA